LVKGWRFPKKLEPVVDRIRPRDIKVFGGSAITEKLGFLDRWMLNKVKAPIGDFRDWEAIISWARDISKALK
jgi:menaquinone-dependent protoporphyrinogen oxidase